MWSIIWKIENKIKHDILAFATEQQASKYAAYYKSLLQVHDRSQHIQKRFGFDTIKEASCVAVDYQIVKKKESEGG